MEKNRQIDCPECNSTHTFATPETAWERFCADCDAVWDIRHPDEFAQEELEQ